MPDRPRPTPPPAKPFATLSSQARPKAAAAAAATAEPPPRPAAKTAKDPAQVITYRCSHTRGVKDFTGTDCPACRDRHRREKNAARRAEAEADRQPPHSKAPTLADTGRLPAGSAKRLVWNGNEWYGVLEVPGCPGAFECRAGTERECYHGLDRLYREYLTTRDGQQSPGEAGP
jgi:hypothetical protein